MKKTDPMEQFGLQAEDMAKTLAVLIDALGNARVQAAKGNAEVTLADAMIISDATRNAEDQCRRLVAWAMQALKVARGVAK